MSFDPFATLDEAAAAQRLRDIIEPDPDSLAADLLDGCQEIAAELGWTVRQTQYALQRGYIPGWRSGRNWKSRKSALRRRFSANGGNGR